MEEYRTVDPFSADGKAREAGPEDTLEMANSRLLGCDLVPRLIKHPYNQILEVLDP